MRVNAPEKAFAVWLDGHVIKSVPIKGLAGQEMAWEQYVALMKVQARSRSTALARIRSTECINSRFRI